MITPRSPSTSGSASIMPAADWAMQRKVPSRLICTTRSKSAIGKVLTSPLLRSRAAVLTPVTMPAQFTSIRSWPLAFRARAKPAATDSSELTSTLQNTAPSSPARTSPRCPFMSKIATLAPSATRRRTTASPRPEAPPVTTAEIPAPSFIDTPLAI